MPNPPPSRRKLDRLLHEARARSAWGDSRETIRQWLLNQDDVVLSEEQVDEILAKNDNQRARTMRWRGLVALVAGLLLVAPGVIGSLWVYRYLDQGGTQSLVFLGLVVAVAAVLIGLWLAYQGLDRLLFGARSSGSESSLFSD